MSYIKTMKGQAVEAGNAVVDWPKDGIINMLIPCDEIVASAIVKEVITQNTQGVSVPVNNADGSSTFAYIADFYVTGAKPIGNGSMIVMLLSDTDSGIGATELEIGAGAGNLFLSSVTGSGVSFTDSDGTLSDNSASLTPQLSDQLILTVLDRPNATLSIYEGTNGDSLVKQFTANDGLTPQGAFDSGGLIKASLEWVNTNGFVVLRFDSELPTNWRAMVTDIAATMRVGATGTFPDDRRVKWIYNIVDKHLL